MWGYLKNSFSKVWPLKPFVLVFFSWSLISSSMVSMVAHAATDAKASLKQMAFQMTGEISAMAEGRKLALRPFIKGQTPLDPIAADRLYGTIYEAFNFVKEMGGFNFVDQRHIMELLNTREEYYMGSPEKLLQEAQADIEIICHPMALVKRVRLSCTASDLETGITYSTREITIPFDANKEGAIDYTAAIELLSQSLASNLSDMNTVGSPAIVDMQSGSETEITELLGSRLLSNLQARVFEKQQQIQRNYEANKTVNEATPAPPPINAHYSARGELRHINKDILELYVIFQEGQRMAAFSSIRLLKASLPQKLQKSIEAQSLNKIHIAYGEAVVSKRLDRDSARHAAINLARARIVAQALGKPAPSFTAIENESDASLILLNSMSDAIPVEERIFDASPQGSGNRIAVEIHAEVKHIGTAIAPNITAKLSHSSYRAGQPIHITIKSAGNANLAIFGWFADGQVVRVYPNKTNAALAIKKGRPIALPRKDESPFMSAPMPVSGNREDQEAFIILATSDNMDFKKLAPLLGDSIGQTISSAKNSSDFFNELGRMDLTKMSLTILPYQVHN